MTFKITEGTLHAVEVESIEFSNPFFCRGQPQLLKRIKRKDTSKPASQTRATQNQLQELMIRLQDHQEDTFKRFEQVTEENDGKPEKSFSHFNIYFLSFSNNRIIFVLFKIIIQRHQIEVALK